MTDEIARTEFESLKERVRELEEIVDGNDGNHTQTERTDIDHRDAAVIDTLSENKHYGGRTLVKKYRKHTDIVNTDKAKERAKRLHGKDCFDGTEFVGWDK